MISTAASSSKPELSTKEDISVSNNKEWEQQNRLYGKINEVNSVCMLISLTKLLRVASPWCAAQVLFSTVLSMFCGAITSLTVSWFSPFLNFCTCSFAVLLLCRYVWLFPNLTHSAFQQMLIYLHFSSGHP